MRFGIFYEHQNPRPWEEEHGRFHVEGDFQVIARLPEMFGQPPQF
jgi:hypothetical protein